MAAVIHDRCIGRCLPWPLLPLHSWSFYQMTRLRGKLYIIQTDNHCLQKLIQKNYICIKTALIFFSLSLIRKHNSKLTFCDNRIVSIAVSITILDILIKIIVYAWTDNNWLQKLIKENYISIKDLFLSLLFLLFKTKILNKFCTLKKFPFLQI